MLILCTIGGRLLDNLKRMTDTYDNKDEKRED